MLKSCSYDYLTFSHPLSLVTFKHFFFFFHFQLLSLIYYIIHSIIHFVMFFPAGLINSSPTFPFAVCNFTLCWKRNFPMTWSFRLHVGRSVGCSVGLSVIIAKRAEGYNSLLLSEHLLYSISLSYYLISLTYLLDEGLSLYPSYSPTLPFIIIFLSS